MKATGGSAFPYSALVPDEETRQLTGTIYADSKGMTIRDYFAAKAMQAMLPSYLLTISGSANPLGPFVATWAYDMADCMLKERDK